MLANVWFQLDFGETKNKCHIGCYRSGIPWYLQALAVVRLRSSGFRRGPSFMFWVLFLAGALCSYCCAEGLIPKMLRDVKLYTNPKP